jgi:hypothetical protein
MEFEKTNLRTINKHDQNNVFMTHSSENSIKRDITNILSLFRIIYVLVILITFIIFIIFKTKRFIVLIGLKVINIFKKDLYYQDKEYNFCDNFRNMYNKDIENQLILFNITLKDIYFDIFMYKNSDYMNNNIQTNAMNEIEIILEMLNAIKYYIDKYNYYTYFENETNPTSACDFFNYILTNYANAYNHGSDPKIVAELILSKMANEIGPEIIYNPPKNIRKTDEISFFLDIYNYFDSLKENIIVSNFYWIREKECICSECNKSTFNFQLNYIHYFYPEVILNRFSSGYYKKYNLCIETCFKYFTKSDQDMTSFACKVCNKRVKPKSILNYMVTLPKYLIFCLFVDKNVVDPINYKLDYGKDIDLKYYFKNIEGNNKTCTLYKFQSGCYSTWNSIHSLAFSYHFDGNLYEFNDSYYKQISDFKELYKENPYLLFYRRADIDLC